MGWSIVDQISLDVNAPLGDLLGRDSPLLPQPPQPRLVLRRGSSGRRGQRGATCLAPTCGRERERGQDGGAEHVLQRLVEEGWGVVAVVHPVLLQQRVRLRVDGARLLGFGGWGMWWGLEGWWDVGQGGGLGVFCDTHTHAQTRPR